ncbi:MAG: SDR family oxidoreductase [Flavobacteriales bacterium]|nr:SDR family oxidoreductase [Flavobacteriales bacterium]
MLEGKKILITGGAGFIGSNLAEYFLRNNQVTVLDNFSTGHMHNLAEHMDNFDFQLIEGDIRNLEDCKKACEGMDIILHQAALGSVPRSINDPITTNQVNIDGFLNMLVAANESSVLRFVYAASSSTYGDSKILPKTEDNIGAPLSPYAVTKYVNELYASVFSNLYDLEIIGLRYFNVFGRRQDPNGAYAAAIPKFISSFLDLKSPIVHGDGSQTRDFTYIQNVIQANELAAETTNPEAFNQVYNVAFGERTVLLDLIKKIQSLLSQINPAIGKVDIRFGPERIGDVKHSLASIDKAKRILGYNPSHSVAKGLDEAIEWYYKELTAK